MKSFHFIEQYEFIKFKECKSIISKLKLEYKECLKNNKKNECMEKIIKLKECNNRIKNYIKLYKM